MPRNVARFTAKHCAMQYNNQVDITNIIYIIASRSATAQLSDRDDKSRKVRLATIGSGSDCASSAFDLERITKWGGRNESEA